MKKGLNPNVFMPSKALKPALDLNTSHSFSNALGPQVLPYTSTQNALKCYPLLFIMNSWVYTW